VLACWRAGVLACWRAGVSIAQSYNDKVILQRKNIPQLTIT